MSKDHACLREESKEDGNLARPGIRDSKLEGVRGCNPINNCQQKGMMLRKVDNKKQIRVESSWIRRREKRTGGGWVAGWIELRASCPPKAEKDERITLPDIS
jgi:hypothetical protein